MRYLGFGLLLGLLVSHASADTLKMSFLIAPLNPTEFEKSVSWNPTTQEALIRLTLVPAAIDPILAKQTLDFSTAKSVQLTVLQSATPTENCSVVSQLQFAYRPDLPDYLMFITLKGEACQGFANNFELYKTNLHFSGMTVPESNPADIDLVIGQ